MTALFNVFLNRFIFPFIAIKNNQKNVITVRKIEINISPKKVIIKTE